MSDSYILKLERLRVELRDILRDKGFVLPDNVDLATLVSKVGGIGDYDLLKAMLSGQPYDIIDTEGVIEVITTTTLYYTGHLARIDLPEVKTVPQSVFKNQTGLTSVKVPKLTVIPSEFCNGCTNLSEVDISAATSIAANAFSNTKALKSITFPQTLTSIVNSFGGSGIEELDIPASTNIGTTQGNFSSCLSLKKVTINGLTNINKGTFNGMRSVRFPPIKQKKDPW